MMMNVNPTNKYDKLSQFFHWVTALMVLAAYLLGPEDFGELVDSGTDPGTQLGIVWHESLGVGVFVLTALRMIWLAIRPSAPQHQLGPKLNFLSRTMHVTLLFLLFAIPLSALLTLASEGYPMTLLGGLRINEFSWLAKSPLAGAADWGEVHQFLGNAIMWLAGIHALAALYHHFRLKDSVLKSMLP